MRTIQMTLDEDLVRAVDQVVKELRTTRSAFARAALREAIANVQTKKLESRHREGYAQHPPGDAESGAWEDEQEWGDA